MGLDLAGLFDGCLGGWYWFWFCLFGGVLLLFCGLFVLFPLLNYHLFSLPKSLITSLFLSHFKSLVISSQSFSLLVTLLLRCLLVPFFASWPLHHSKWNFHLISPPPLSASLLAMVIATFICGQLPQRPLPSRHYFCIKLCIQITSTHSSLPSCLQLPSPSCIYLDILCPDVSQLTSLCNQKILSGNTEESNSSPVAPSSVSVFSTIFHLVLHH